MASRRAVGAVAAVVAIVVAAAALVVVTRRAETPEPQLGALLEDVVAAGAPGALALVVDGSSRQTAASGLADRERGRPLRPDDRFRAGSITKSFVASVVLQLAAEGKLGLDDPVERWLPGLVPAGITVRHLLAHTSGLPDYVDDPRVVAGRRFAPRALVAIATSRPSLGLPGERYAYASTNYVVLGLLVERVTRTRLAVQLERRIFRPFHLSATSFAPVAARELDVRGYRAAIHDGLVRGELKPTTGADASWAWAAGAMVSDADDLATFFTALLEGRIVPEPLLGQMIPERGYGLGVATFRTPCGIAVGHTGNLLGYVSVVWSTPDADRQVVLMVNTYPLAPDAEQAIHHALESAFCGRISG
jgi:D-alanyl-D-alanine carboxypeptidase